MSDSVFLDSNVLVYAYSYNEPAKQLTARQIIQHQTTLISTQVLQELVNIVTKKYKYSYTDAQQVVAENLQNNQLHTNTATTILSACEVAQQYKFSFYDSLIIAAALESNCSILYSEDLHNGLVVKDKLTIINPFI